MGDTAINVPVEVRSHELTQIHEMVPAARDDLVDADNDDDAETVRRIYDEHIKGVEQSFSEDESFAAYLSMPVEDWRMVIRYLNRTTRDEGRIRVHWLQEKLVTRLEDRLDELED